MTTPRLRMPQTARAGEVIEIRTLLSHPMFTAVSAEGPRDMLARFEASMNGAPIFGFEFGNGSAANPTFTFFTRVEAPGDFAFVWTHEDGQTFETTRSVTVS
jgi:sulfur-oxidizing protein SoxZ